MLLPELIDDDGDEIKQISIAPKLIWIKLLWDPNNSKNVKLFVDLRSLTKDDVGSTELKITLTDEFGASRVIKQAVSVIFDDSQLTQPNNTTI